MSVLSYVAGDVFRLRIYKYHFNNPGVKWSNEYNLVANVAGDVTAWEQVVTDFVTWERNLHSSLIVFDRAIVSTYSPDSDPYNGDEFVTINLNLPGLVGTGEDQLVDLRQVLFVAKEAAAGRQGRLFFRGVLIEADLTAPSGTAVISSQNRIDGLMTTALQSLTPYIGNVPTGEFSLVLVFTLFGNIQVRVVITLTKKGVTVSKLNKRYFNRAGGGLPPPP